MKNTTHAGLLLGALCWLVAGEGSVTEFRVTKTGCTKFFLLSEPWILTGVLCFGHGLNSILSWVKFLS